MPRRRVSSPSTAPVVRLALILAVAASFTASLAPRVAARPTTPNWSPPAIVYIPATGHTIAGLFLDLWRSGGGAPSFGNPITREITAPDGHVVQYFRYARFEYWPDGDASGQTVTLGRVGAELGPPLLLPRPPTSRRAPTTAALSEARAWLLLTAADASRRARAEPTYRFVPATGHGVWAGFRSFWEATGADSYLGNPLTEEYALDGASYQVFERGKLRWRPGEEVSLVPVGALLVERYGVSTKAENRGHVPIYDEALFVPPVIHLDPKSAPGPPAGHGRSIVVSLRQQRLWAFDGKKLVRTSFVSTGREGFETPTGTYHILTKLESQTMEGVIGGEYYNVPNVPWVMYFTDLGHALHGTYWHNNFGAPMSHGCVNLPMDVAAWLYQWAPVGTPVLIGR